MVDYEKIVLDYAVTRIELSAAKKRLAEFKREFVCGKKTSAEFEILIDAIPLIKLQDDKNKRRLLYAGRKLIKLKGKLQDNENAAMYKESQENEK